MEGSLCDGQESEQGDLLVIVMSLEKRWLNEFHVQGDFSAPHQRRRHPVVGKKPRCYARNDKAFRGMEGGVQTPVV